MSQEQLILANLKRGHYLTPLDALEKFSSISEEAKKMNINDIKVGERYQYYFYDNEKRLRHFPVDVVKVNRRSIRVKHDDLEMRVSPSELDNRQMDAFDD